VLSELTPGLRHQGLSVWVGNDRYIFKNGITNADLVLDAGGSSVGAWTDISGPKLFLSGELGLQNDANTFTSSLFNQNTASRAYLLPDATGTFLISGADNLLAAETNVNENFDINFGTTAAVGSVRFLIDPTGPNGPTTNILPTGFVVLMSGGQDQFAPLNISHQISGQFGESLISDGILSQFDGSISRIQRSISIYSTICPNSNIIDEVSSDQATTRMNMNAYSGLYSISSSGPSTSKLFEVTGFDLMRLPFTQNGYLRTTGGNGTVVVDTTIPGSLNNLTGTNANITAAVQTRYYLPSATLSANRNFVMPTATAGDIIKVFNDESTFTWNLTGSPVYLANNVTVLTSLSANANYQFEYVNGRWRILN
jgi:hypothetical protein